jgi:uncharacterized protein YecT (DUF1311 family)
MTQTSSIEISTMKYSSILPACALLYLAVAHADQSAGANGANAVRKGCNDAPPGTQLQLGLCAQADFHDADLEMSALYVQKMTRLREPAHSRLRDAQKAWIVFRDKSCLYEAGTQEESGTVWGMDVSQCMTAHTRQRIKELEEYIACTQDGCLGPSS